ncbi:MAG TPA: hypothetical protein VGO93_16665, partial [Candidatus Xenobia bacterium]
MHVKSRHRSEPPARPPLTRPAESTDPADTREVAADHHHRHLVAKVTLGGLAALSACTGLAAVAAPSTPPPAQAVTTVTHAAVPSSVQKEMGDIHGILQVNPDHEPAQEAGTLYAVYPNQNGAADILATRNGTTPTGNNIPSNAVKDNRVVIMTEGIGDQVPSYAHDSHQFFQSNQNSWDVNLGQPLIGIHEGTSTHVYQDVLRVAKDYVDTKTVENGGHVSMSSVDQNDPAVQTAYNVYKQQLDQGHDMLLIPHSGGGPEDALALNMLSQSSPHYKTLIGEHVRILSLAGAAAPGDYVDAGVHSNNIYYVATSHDPIGLFGEHYVDPTQPGS